jgi:hypothetical protein
VKEDPDLESSLENGLARHMEQDPKEYERLAVDEVDSAEFERIGLEIVDSAEKSGVTLRLLGAVAFRHHCPVHKDLQVSMHRVLTDLDFAAYYKQEKAIDKFFLNDLGYVSQTASLTPGLMIGRKIYLDPTGERPHIDVFFDKLNMCHVVSWEKGQLELDTPTISLALLMLEKLQIVHINEKDVKDVMMLLLEHEVGDSDSEVVNGKNMSKIMAKDWGFYYTSTTNLNKVKSLLGDYDALSSGDRDVISARIDDLLNMIEKEPKSLGWKLRAKVGTKKQWYNDVEEVERAEHLT